MGFKVDTGRPANSELQLSTLDVIKAWATDFAEIFYIDIYN